MELGIVGEKEEEKGRWQVRQQVWRGVWHSLSLSKLAHPTRGAIDTDF